MDSKTRSTYVLPQTDFRSKYTDRLKVLLLLSHFSCVRLCVTPETAAHQAPPSLGFSRQEHWSGLPFPSPMHESEKWKWSRSVVSDPWRPHGQQPIMFLRPWGFPGKSTGVGCHCLLWDWKWGDGKRYSVQIEMISYKKRIAGPGSMQDTGSLGLVHWDDTEGWYGEGGGRGVQDGEHV